MRTRRTKWLSGVAVVVLVLSVGIVMAEPPPSNPGTPFSAILDKLDQVLAAIANLSAGAPPPCGAGTTGQRFVVSPDGMEVCDNTTGLNWQKNPDSTLRTQADAMVYCPTVRPASRLPEVKELISLLDYTTFNPALPASHPFTNVQSALYWSASPDAGNASNAWLVDFSDGVVADGSKTSSRQVWCVRGG